MIKEVGEDNCGVNIDYGHTVVAYENEAETVVALKNGDRFINVYMKDNYDYWDENMIVGSVSTISCLVFIYWLKRTSYTG